MLRHAYASSSKFLRPRQCAGYRLKAVNTVQELGHEGNAPLIDYLKQSREARQDDAASSKGIEKAIDRVYASKTPIRTVDDLKKLPRLNPHMKATIEAWLAGQDYVGITALMQDSQEIMQVPTIGPLRAAELVKAGAKTIGDLRKPEYYETLSPSQKTFLDFQHILHDPSDLQTAQRVQAAVQGALKPTVNVVIVGDHRRGLEKSSSTQLLVINPDHEYVPSPASTGSLAYYCVGKSEAAQGNLTQETVELLTRRGICVAEFRFTSHKWTGLVRIPGKNEDGEWESMAERLRGVKERKGEFKRADIFFVPAKSRGAALITTTGDDGMISHVRKKAEELGLHFNEFGLWRLDPSKPSSKTARKHTADQWKRLSAETEEEIFAELGLDWIDPVNRNFGVLQPGAVPKNRKKY